MVFVDLGGFQVLHNAVGGGRVSDFPEKALRRCTVERYYRYEGVGVEFPEKSVK